MSRAARRQNVGVALFPFLAVLICTMGALIVLLVLLVQQARVDASTIAARHSAAAESPQLRERLEDAQWRRETLETSRAEKSQELADSRGKLAHLEDHMQRLQERAKELMERARLIDEGSELRADDLAVVREEIARVQGEVEQQKRKIDDAKANANKESWYALIPYDGPQGTRRRPIYLECTGEGVVIQPEGIVLQAQDFQGPLGPGNPLDAALRMIRSHLESVHGGKAGQPYPLVVVRPSGVAAYGAARSALKSWDDEFGYELLGDDKRLDFGSPDPALAASLNKTVAVARQKQAVMVAMMPRTFNEEPLQSFADTIPAAPAGAGGGSGIGAGGRVGPGTTGIHGGGANGPSPGSDASAMAGGRGGAYGAGPMSSAAGVGLASSGGGNPGTPGAGPGGSMASNAGGLAGSGEATPSGPVLGSPGGNTPPGRAAIGAAQQASGNPGAAGATGGNMSGGSASAAMGRPSPPGGTPGGAGGGGAFAPSQAGGTPVPNLPFGQAGQSTSTSSSASSSGSSGGKSGTSKSGKSRGRNWALTEAKPHSIGVTRPLHVAVHADRLLIVPDQGDSRLPVVVPIAPELRPEDVNQFVTAVQREVKGWGLAVANGYWKPVLHMGVAPGAEQQFVELQTALEGSGFDILRR